MPILVRMNGGSIPQITKLQCKWKLGESRSELHLMLFSVQEQGRPIGFYIQVVFRKP